MAGGLKRRVELLEARAAAAVPLSEPDEAAMRQRVERRVEAADAAQRAYEAATVEERIAIKLQELAELRARERRDCLHDLRIRLVEIDIEELQGLSSAAAAAEQRLAAHFQVGGRVNEPPSKPCPEPSAAPPDVASETETAPLIVGRTKGPPNWRDLLKDFRDEPRLSLEPRWT